MEMYQNGLLRPPSALHKATHPDFRYQPLAAPEELGNGGGVGGSRAVLVKRQCTPRLISSLRGTAGFPPSISFSTSYPEPFKEIFF